VGRVETKGPVAARVAPAKAPEVEPGCVVAGPTRFEAAPTRGAGHGRDLAVAHGALQPSQRVHLERHGISSDLIRVVI